MDCPLQTVHMCLLKGILGVKRTTPNWSVLCECGQEPLVAEPLQIYWFRAAVRFYNALLCSKSSTLAKVLKADFAMSTINKKCWSAEFLDAFHGLERSGDFQHCVRIFQTIPQSQFVVDVRERMRSIWNQANQLGNEDQMDKAAKYHNWVALPLRSVTVDGCLFLYLGICILIYASKHSATWHVSGYIPVRCESRREAGNIMMVPVITCLKELWG